MADKSHIAAHDGIWVVGRSARTSNEDPGAIGTLWGSVFADPFMEQVTGRVGDELHAVYCEYEGDHTQPYTFVLGYRVEEHAELPEGLHKTHVPGGAFARHVAEGEQPAALIEAWQKIWAEPVERAFAADYEVHHDGGSRVEIFVGVR